MPERKLSSASSGSGSSGFSRWATIQKQLNSPLPSSLANECKKAEKILDSFIHPRGSKSGNADLGIPRKILARAKGLAIFTAVKVGAVGSIRFGSGLIVARLSDGSWSAPSAMATGGIGFGSQIGFELTDFVFVLNSDAAVKTFTQSGSLTLGRNVSVALGPYGRSGEVGGAVGSKGMVGMFAYSKTRGIFGGRSLEGGMMGERLEANKEMYGAELTARQLLSGKIPPPPEAEPLMRLLNSERFYTVSPISSSAELPSKNIHQQAAGLPAELAHEPPNGISELCAGEVSQVAELDAGPQHAIYEMPAGDDDTKVYELDASSPVSQPPKHDALSVKLDVPARSSKYDLLQKELPPLPLE